MVLMAEAHLLAEVSAARLLPKVRRLAPHQKTQSVDLQALRETGATGLEPATSGVTGRYGVDCHSRLRPGITGWSKLFPTERTGCDRLPPGRARVVHV
jgi:hypothetical protein